MLARNVSLRLKPNTLSEVTRIFDKEVIPMLRKQSGFRDEITFAVPGGLDVVALSLLWYALLPMRGSNKITHPRTEELAGHPSIRAFATRFLS
jgi:hypothetical protein